MGLIKRGGIAGIVACAAVLATGAPASAVVTIGQVAPGSGALVSCPTGPTDLVQPSVTAGGNLYSARAAGRITSWSTRSGGSGSYTLKVFRRTTDPDVFRVIGHSGPHPLTSGLKTFSANLAVSSGDLIGLNATGAAGPGNNTCAFSSPGDFVLSSSGNLPDGGSENFPPGSAMDNVRLNLSATLVPTNAFGFGAVTRDRRKGTATLEVLVSNPGSVTLAGKGLKLKRATKTVAVAGPVRFAIAAAGKKEKKLKRKGRVSVQVNATFTPTGGDPAGQSISLKLKKKLRKKL
jgi:hypothetical protein